MSKTKRKRLFMWGLIGIAAIFAVCLVVMVIADPKAAAFAGGLPLAGFAGALAADRDTPMRTGDRFELGAATAKKFYAGALVMRSATGYATPGATATGCIGLGRVAEYVDNTSGADGAVKVKIDRGIFRYGNSAAADEIANADIGTLCFIVDDATVAKTDGGGTRSTAGRVVEVDSSGVWVEFLHMASVAAGVSTADIDNDAVTNDKLANITRGSVKVGGAANAPTDLDGKTAGRFLKGDGTDIVSTQQILAVVADPGTGVALPNDKSCTIHITTAAAETNTLAAPAAAGLLMALTCDVYAVGDRVVTCATTVNQTGNNTLTFGAAGDTILLYSVQIGGALRWRVAANDGVALSTV